MADQAVSRFWDVFIDKSKFYGAKGKAVRWYVRHAEAYIKAHQGIKLSFHTPEQVDTYLKEKGRNIRLEDWQFMQIVRN